MTRSDGDDIPFSGLIILVHRPRRALERADLVKLIERVGEAGLCGAIHFAWDWQRTDSMACHFDGACHLPILVSFCYRALQHTMTSALQSPAGNPDAIG